MLNKVGTILQLIRRSADTWEVFKVDEVMIAEPPVSSYELIALIRLDSAVDRFIVEKPTWLTQGPEFRKDGGYFLTLAAALRFVTTPSAAAKKVVS